MLVIMATTTMSNETTSKMWIIVKVRNSDVLCSSSIRFSSCNFPLRSSLLNFFVCMQFPRVPVTYIEKYVMWTYIHFIIQLTRKNKKSSFAQSNERIATWEREREKIQSDEWTKNQRKLTEIALRRLYTCNCCYGYLSVRLVYFLASIEWIRRQ